MQWVSDAYLETDAIQVVGVFDHHLVDTVERRGGRADALPDGHKGPPAVAT